MSNAPTALVVDTNVWLDCYLPNRPGQTESLCAIAKARELGIPMFYTAGQAQNIFFLIGSIMKRRVREGAGEFTDGTAQSVLGYQWAAMDNLEEMATVVGADASDVWLAKKHRALHSDFGDNLIIAAAERAKADFIVTNDETLMKHAPVATISPKNLTALLEAFDEDD